MATGHAQEYHDDLPKRISELEKYVAQQGTSVSSLVTAQAAIVQRLEKLEMLAQMRAITEAREDERDKALYDRLDRIETTLSETKKDLQAQIKATKDDLMSFKGIGIKALWVFISSFIVAGAAWIIKGGFK